MDILYLLDRLEETLSSGTHVPFTSRSLIDEQEALDVLDQIRVAIPEELKQARRLIAERDSIVAEAQQRAEQIRQEAEQLVHQRLEDHAIVRLAERRAEELRREAMQAADEMRREMDLYSYRVLARLQSHLQALLDQVERGMRSLEEKIDLEEEAAMDEVSTRQHRVDRTTSREEPDE